ncbi:hypothetical protein OAK38_06225 [Verrucomicrobia bacterium]|nr:hypothetical protein [Verrucomicrobiota bacterium]
MELDLFCFLATEGVESMDIMESILIVVVFIFGVGGLLGLLFLFWAKIWKKTAKSSLMPQVKSAIDQFKEGEEHKKDAAFAKAKGGDYSHLLYDIHATLKAIRWTLLAIGLLLGLSALGIIYQFDHL